MKHLLTGVAMAAALGIISPVWAQTSMAPASPPAAAPASPPAAAPTPGPAHGPKSERRFLHRVVHTPRSAEAPMPGPAHGPMSERRFLHRVVHHQRMMNSGDEMSEQLNAQELQRILSGAPPAAAPMAPMAPGGNNPTSGTAGPFYR